MFSYLYKIICIKLFVANYLLRTICCRLFVADYLLQIRIGDYLQLAKFQWAGF